MVNLTQVLGFHLYHQDDLVMSLQQFGLGKQTSAAWKALKDDANQHQVIAGGGAAPSLSDADTLMVPCSVYLPDTLSMAWGAVMRLRVVLANFFGPDHPTVLALKEVN